MIGVKSFLQRHRRAWHKNQDSPHNAVHEDVLPLSKGYDGGQARHFALPIITKGRYKKRFFGLDTSARRGQHVGVTGTCLDGSA
jgi:hypothetical protein